MLQLNNETLRDFLGDVFFGGDKDKYIKCVIPLQGNWWTPTENEGATISTWVGYNLYEIEPRIRARYVTNETGTALVSTCMAKVHLQIIGKDAESLARSLIHWDERTDVAEMLGRFAGQLCYDKRKVVSTLYYQDGQNSTISHNVDFRFLFADVVEPQLSGITGMEVNGMIYY